jgi:hypothetical protein
MVQLQVKEKAAAIDDLLLMGAPQIRQGLKQMFLTAISDDLTPETKGHVIAAYEVLDNHLEQCEQFLLYEPAMT